MLWNLGSGGYGDQPLGVKLIEHRRFDSTRIGITAKHGKGDVIMTIVKMVTGKIFHIYTRFVQHLPGYEVTHSG